MSAGWAVGLDLGGTNIKSAVVSAEGVVRHRLMRPTSAERGSEPTLDAMAAQILDTIAEAKLRSEDIAGLGVGAPGPLSHRRGIIYKAANLPGWINVPIRAGLARRTGLATVVHNDGNAAAYGEYWAGGRHAAGDLVMLTLGTGVGAGVVLDGKPLQGHFENAAELGHVIVIPDGLPCSCGQRGCLEQYASASGVVRRFLEAVARGRRSALMPSAEPASEFSCQDIVSAALNGDPLAAEVWEDACRCLALACVFIQHAYNPATVLFGGGMSQTGEILVTRVRAHFESLRWHLADDGPTLGLARLGNDAGVVGAAGLALLEVGEE